MYMNKYYILTVSLPSWGLFKWNFMSVIQFKKNVDILRRLQGQLLKWEIQEHWSVKENEEKN